MADDNILEIGETSIENRRQFNRRAFTIEIQFDGGEARGKATTRDIGIGGLYMATDAVLSEGVPLTMRMTLGGQELNINGFVVYCDPGQGVGVRFHNLSLQDEDVLRSVMFFS